MTPLLLSAPRQERLVRYKRFNTLEPHLLYGIEVPDTAIETVSAPPAGWDAEDPLPAAQAMGNAWCDNGTSPAPLVPSAVTPGERNLMVNTRHRGWRWSWVVSGPHPFAFDARPVELLERAEP